MRGSTRERATGAGGPAPRGCRITHADRPVVPSPSGLPSRHLVSRDDGAVALFLGEQWLQPGDQVRHHTHPVEEIVTFLAGAGEATLGDELVTIGAGTSLYIPAGIVHGFRCTGRDPLHVLIVFPTPVFAATTMTGD